MTSTPVLRAESAVPGDAPVVAVRDLTVRTGSRTLVEDVSFTIGGGQRVGMIGASGSGKTVTASVVAGLLPGGMTASGSVRYPAAGVDMVRASEPALARVRGLQVGMVFQEPMTALNPTMRVGRQIAEAVEMHARGATRTGIRRRVQALIADVGLDTVPRCTRRYPHELSGGQRQRVALAIALANEPRLLICDEPTTALDVSTQAQMLALIEARTSAASASLLFISHDVAVVGALCDYLLVMWQGTVVEHGPTLEILETPRHPHTRALVADARALGEWSDDSARGAAP